MSHSSAPERENGAVITDWRPEDPAFWQQRGHRVASRNLWISVPCLLLAFCVWMLFSAVAVNLPSVYVYDRSAVYADRAAVAVRRAAARPLRVYGAGVWRPSLDGVQYRDHDRPLRVARLRGAGYLHAVQRVRDYLSAVRFCRANFASSMANISFFFPKAKQGGALGINGGLGNMGVSVMQLVAPLAISVSIFAAFGGGGVEQPDGSCCICKTPRGSGCRSWWSSPWRPGSL
jgi:NNP family nitrate/nitrite transporter-like MFS transporter